SHDLDRTVRLSQVPSGEPDRRTRSPLCADGLFDRGDGAVVDRAEPIRGIGQCGDPRTAQFPDWRWIVCALDTESGEFARRRWRQRPRTPAQTLRREYDL